MNKYIVKNCPCFNSKYNECNSENRQKIYCMDNNCLIRQIISRCKNIKNLLNGFDDDYNLGRITTAQGILELFEIAEAEQ